MKIKYLVILIFGICCSVNGQKVFPILESSEEKFQHITSEDGLMHNSIAAILQDSKGYMWFGTSNGLYKYNGYDFKYYTNSPDDDSTLLNKQVKTLFEDKKGNIWIGTAEGICIYDRSSDSFNNYLGSDINQVNQIKESINCIYEDNNGVFWIGTKLGLYKLILDGDNGFITELITYGTSKEGLSSNSVLSIIEDTNDNLWIATNNGLNLYIESEDGSFWFEKHIIEKDRSSNYISKLLIDDQGTLWLGAKKGVYKMNVKSLTGVVSFTSYLFKDEATNSLSENFVTSLDKDFNGNIWYGTRSGGLKKFNIETGIFKHYKGTKFSKNSLRSNGISNLFIDDSGVLWVGTRRGGLSKLNLANKKVAHYNYNYFDKNSLSGNNINSIYEDSKGNIWIATHEEGLNRIVNTKKGPKFIHYKKGYSDEKSLSSNSVFGICEDNFGNYWIGTQASGLDHVQISKNLESNDINVINYENNPEYKNFPTNKISTLFKDRLGDVWVGTLGNGGLFKFTPKQFGDSKPEFHSFKHDVTNFNSISNAGIVSIFEDSDNILWIGTSGGGLNKVIRDEFNNPVKFIKIVNEPKNLKSLSDNSVFSIQEDRDENIWIGTFGGGLNKIPANQKDKLVPEIVRYTMKDGLPSNEIYGILEDESGNLWMSTNNGISKFNVAEESFKNLNLSNGLQDVNFRKLAYHKGANGLMYFGGINGLNIFYPEGFNDNKFLPKTEIVDFKVFGHSVKPKEKILGKTILTKVIEETKTIVLKNAHNTFSFEFAGLHYGSPSQNKYAFMLEGVDEDWIVTDAEHRVANYSNLSAGNYKFKVKSSNNDSIWNENYKEVAIKILPPFWKTWWAYLIYFLLFVFVMWLFKKYILINEEYQNKIKIEKIEQEKIKEINKMKLEFFTNVSHEFKTPLTLILGPIQQLINSKETSAKVRNSLMLMERNANQLFRLVNQIMEFRKVENKELKLQPSKGDMVNFCREEVFSFKMLANQNNLNLIFECGEYSIEGFFDWDKMEKILNNLISNSIKFSDEGGTIKVSLSIPVNQKQRKIETFENEHRYVRIVVEDTGEGIPQNQLSLIFERFYQINKNSKAGANGSGIGLALTKSLIEMHKGTISVESVENKGSRFIIELPLLTELKLLSHPSKDVDKKKYNDKISGNLSEPKKNEGEINEKSPTILLVEDNPDMLEFISSTLDSKYNICKASDGVEGLKKALDIVPDLIVSDVMMPNMDGIEFCERVKNHEITDHIPVILLTAKGSTDHRIEGLEVGADSYIPKPFDMRHLEVRIQKLMLQRNTLKQKFTKGGIKLDSEKVGINRSEKIFLEKIEKIMEENLTNSDFGVEDLGDALGYSRMQLYRKLKSVRGISANEFMREYRIKKAAVYLRETDMRIFEILYEIGISNHSYFTKCFKQYFNKSPREYIDEYRKN